MRCRVCRAREQHCGEADDLRRGAYRAWRRSRSFANAVLSKPAREILAGTFGAGEADLGSGLFKKRLARPGHGTSGGYRAIVAYRALRSDRVLVACAFAKNAATLTAQGHDALSKVAQAFVAAGDEQLAELLASRDVSEVVCDDDGKG